MLDSDRRLRLARSAALVLRRSRTVARGCSDPHKSPIPTQLASNPKSRRSKPGTAKTPSRRDAVLFVGSSSIRMWPTAESFPESASHQPRLRRLAHLRREPLRRAHRPQVLAADDRVLRRRQRHRSRQIAATSVRRFSSLRQTGPRPPAQNAHHLSADQTQHCPLAKMAANARRQLAVSSSFRKRDERIIYVDTATPMLGRRWQAAQRTFPRRRPALNAKGYALWTETLRPALQRSAVATSLKAASERKNAVDPTLAATRLPAIRIRLIRRQTNCRALQSPRR